MSLLKNMEVYNFGTDINQLLYLIINTFYSCKDIFLRELISNSWDALEKYRYNLMKNGNFQSITDFNINVFLHENNLCIEDNGIGMTKQDLIDNLGTIASSGTKKFLEMIKNKSDEDKSIDQIGQFGVGFYSSFLVANVVNVYTKCENENIYLWSSNSDNKYTIEEISFEKFNEKFYKYLNKDFNHGTLIELVLKDDEYRDQNKLENVIKKYSQFISYPIYLRKKIKKEVEKIDEELEFNKELNPNNESNKIDEETNKNDDEGEC